MNPLVTIAIPIFNADKYLSYTILSVINQSYENWELLLMEDGSTDNSLLIAQKFAKADRRIRLIYDGENKGLVSRLNQSIDLAKGVFYARMDADDIMAITRISKQVNCLLKDNTIDVCGCSTMLIDSSNNIMGSQNMTGVYDLFVHPTVMGRTEWFRRNHYDSAAVRIEDRDLWLRTYRYSKFFNIPEALFFYRAFGTPSSSQNLASNKRLRALYKHYKKYNETISWCIKNCIKTYAKDTIFLLLNFFHMNYILTKIRGRKSLPQNLCLSQEDLEAAIVCH